MTLPVVLIIQHDVHDKPCYFGTYLETHAIPYVMFRCYEPNGAATLPATVTETLLGVPLKTTDDGVVLSYEVVPHGGEVPPDTSEAPRPVKPLRIAGVASVGGYMSVNDHLPYFETVFSLYRSALDLRIPVIGHCLGAQLLSAALGGAITPSPAVELGWVSIDTNVVEGGDDEAAAGHGAVFDWFGADQTKALVFEWHGETFSIPDGCVRLAQSATCPNQAFQVLGKPALGMQFHVEVERSKMESWVAEGHPSLFPTKSSRQAALEDPQQAAHVSPSAMTVEEMFDAALFDERLANSKALADHIYQTWTSFLSLQ